LEENKKGDSQFLFDKSPTVHGSTPIPNQINTYLAKIDSLKYIEF